MKDRLKTVFISNQPIDQYKQSPHTVPMKDKDKFHCDIDSSHENSKVHTKVVKFKQDILRKSTKKRSECN